MELSLHELIEKLQSRDECERIEAKETKVKLGKSPLETISAFSNEPDLGGGYLICGLKKNENEDSDQRYIIQGVDDPDQVQQDLARACRNDFNIRISPNIKVDTYNDKPIVWTFIPEAQSHDKPIFIESKGVKKGAFRRIGPADYHCTSEDLDRLYQLTSDISYEDTICPESSWEDIDKEAIEEYRRLRKEFDPEAKELLFTDHELLESLKVLKNDNGKLVPTIGGMLLFGKKDAIRRTMPISARVDYILVEGTEWVGDPSKRFHAIGFEEPLIFLISRLHIQVMNDIPKGFSLKSGSLHRTDIPTIPSNAVREALANALMHRDYRSGQSSQIIRYSNRLEFHNAGYSLKPIKNLGTPGSFTRNKRIASIFLSLHICEAKGTGIRAIKTWMKEAGLTTPPIFESDREGNKFSLVFLPHHLMNKEDLLWLQQFENLHLKEADSRALILTKELGAITNEDYRQLNNVDTLAASSNLRQLCEKELLIKKGGGNKTYYTLAKQCESLPDKELSTKLDLGDKERTGGISQGDKEITREISPLHKGLDALPKGFPELPEELKKRIVDLGHRTPDTKEFKEIIKELCSLAPLKRSQLANILGRTSDHLKKHYLSKMIQSKELVYLYPDNLAHPQQAYKTPDQDK